MMKGRKILFALSLGLLLTSCGGSKTYTVTWVNADGKVLEKDTGLITNSMPVYDGETPTKASDAQYDYTFKGWSPSIGKVVNNVTYKATFSKTLTHALVSFNLNGGTSSKQLDDVLAAEITSDLFDYEVSKEGFTFGGWVYGDNIAFDSSGNKVSDIDIEEKMTFTASFNRNFDDVWKVAHGVIPSINESKTEVTYGMYPQTLVTDQDIIDNLNQLDQNDYNEIGYYYNNEYYAKVSPADPAMSTSIWSNNEVVQVRDKQTDKICTYWFKVEPISWKVLKDNGDGSYLLLSNNILNSCPYNYVITHDTVDGKDIPASDYANSDIRNFLNNSFMKKAFSLDSSSLIPTVLEEGISDKVFMLSKQDYLNTSYGFDDSTSTNMSRCCTVSDYAVANHTYVYSSKDRMTTFLHYGNYWTRSVSTRTTQDYLIEVNNYDSTFAGQAVTTSSLGVRPAITVKLDIK